MLQRMGIVFALLASAAVLAGCNGVPGQEVTEAPPGDVTAPPATETVEELATPEPVEDTPTVAAETEEPTVEPAEEPTEAAAQPGTLIAMYTPEGSVQVVDTGTGEVTPLADLTVDITVAPHLPVGVAGGQIFVIGDDFSDDAPAQVYSIGRDGTVEPRDEFGPAVHSLAAYDGGEAADYLAWGTFDIGEEQVTSGLYLTSLGDMNTQTIIEQTTPEGWNFVPVRWSEDGQRLFFAEEPSGLGGYIPFDGYSSLYVYDMAAGGDPALLVPNSRAGMICIDDLSPDEQLIVHHCDPDRLTLFDMASGESTAVESPVTAGENQLAGSARFSPDGSRVAYGIARGNPEDELGYLILADVASGQAELIGESEPGSIFRVLSWLDDSTLLVEMSGMENTLWRLPLDGGEPVLLGQGFYLATLPPDWFAE